MEDYCIMNEIAICTDDMPVVEAADYLAAGEPFYHADRLADFNVLIYVTGGTIYVTEDDTDYEISEGELFFLKSGVHHFGRKLIPLATSWYYAHFYLPQGEKKSCSAAVPKKLTGLVGTELEQDIKNFTECINSDLPQKKCLSNALLALLLWKCVYYDTSENGARSLSDRVADFLSENACRPFSSAELENNFFLSYKHMAAVFRREKGTTMQQYHFTLKMQTACKLLRSTLLPVGEISAQLGFSDMLYFSRCFHRFSGLSPTRYRQKILAEAAGKV